MMSKAAFIKILDSVDSTNNYAMAKVRTGMAEHGEAFVAKGQTAGKGQRGKSWQMAAGQSIALSLIVHYYSSNSPTPKLSTWAGGKQNDKIVLSMPQKAPNGMDGFSRLTFYDISDNGFKWIGEWIDASGQVAFPFWKIDCTKRKP